jgi:hypothetical protein
MKRTAHIISIPTSGVNGFQWQWRSEDGKQSGSSFEYYHECVENAREAGYEVHLQGSAAKNMDGSDRGKLT